MHPNESWLMRIQELPQPLQTWLQKSYLTQTSDGSCVLFVTLSNQDFLNNFSYLSQIYPLVKDIYPDATSLYITFSSFQDFIKSGKMEVYSIEATK